jgi:hypothetical protein
MAKCRFCQNDAADSEVCTSCRNSLGLSNLGPMRRSLPCQRCNHPELIRALARELAATSGDWSGNRAVPMAVTIQPAVRHTFFTERRDGIGVLDPEKVMGVLEMYICRKCGFTEWYCLDPQNVPIGEGYGTELVTVEPDTPFR